MKILLILMLYGTSSFYDTLTNSYDGNLTIIGNSNHDLDNKTIAARDEDYGNVSTVDTSLEKGQVVDT